MLIIAYIVVAGCIITIHGKVYERCELASELRDVHEIPDNQLATWVCIARHESEYNTSAINHGSGDHGLLQISELFWCSPPGYACGVSCDDLRNDDIEDDVICARRVYREHKRLSGDGFNAWVVYGLYCRDKHYANTFLEGCFKPGTLKTSVDEVEKPLPTVDYYPQFNRKTTEPTTVQDFSDITEKIVLSEATTSTLKLKLSSTTKPIKITKVPTSATTTRRRIQSTSKEQLITQKPTFKTTKYISKATTKITTTTPRVKLTTKKTISLSSLGTSASTTAKPSNALINNLGKPLRPTEENDEFTYAISKTGYKFTRF